MNDTLNKTETVKMPFPCNVNSPCPNEQVRELSREIVTTEKDLANTLASAGNVHAYVLPHYTDTERGIYGIEQLICSILKDRSASFPKGEEQGEFRKVVLATSMYAHEIITEVEIAYTKANSRYPSDTVYHYLTTVLLKKEKVCRITLTNEEDKIRFSQPNAQGKTSDKPRKKYYFNESYSQE